MSTETNQAAAPAETGAGEGIEVARIELDKHEYERLLSDRASLGSLKREMKDLKKSLETRETPQETKSDLGLLQKSYLRAAGITDADEVNLALETAKKWGVEVDSLVDDEDFKVKLERLRTKKSNEIATSDIKAGAGTSQAKLTPEYWMAKGAPPTAQDVPDRKVRASIARAMMQNARTGGKKFYND